MIECSNPCEVEQGQVVLSFQKHLHFSPLGLVGLIFPRAILSVDLSIEWMNCYLCYSFAVLKWWTHRCDDWEAVLYAPRDCSQIGLLKPIYFYFRLRCASIVGDGSVCSGRMPMEGPYLYKTPQRADPSVGGFFLSFSFNV